MLILLRRIVFLIIVLVSPLYSLAQDTPLTEGEIERYQQELKRMVGFFQFTLNTLGDPLTTAPQKETIINESYAKFFRDEKVQIEDDLIANRTAVVNKDVQAYLKDISFFYRSVSFQWLIENITYERNDAGEIYFLVEGSRILKGVTLDGDSVENSMPRFIEVNLDRVIDQLKIVSVYTTRENEVAFLMGWWKSLPPSWQHFFAPDLYIRDSLTLATIWEHFPDAALGDTLVARREEKVWADDSSTLVLLAAIKPDIQLGDTVLVSRNDTTILAGTTILQSIRRLIRQDELDLSGQTSIKSLQPLSQMTALKSLNLSQTQVEDLFPIRNLVYLQNLNLRQTPISRLGPLRYVARLQTLDLAQTQVEDLQTIQYLTELRQLNLTQTVVSDLTPLQALTHLSQLYLRGTAVKSLVPLRGMTALQRLDISDTQITTLKALQDLPALKALYINYTPLADLGPLGSLPALSLLFCEHTEVANLDPLLSLANLRRVYCDSSRVQAAHARSFMAKRPGTLVVYGSMALRSWWISLDSVWQDAFRARFNITMLPKREQLHQIAGLTSLDLSGQDRLQTLQPLRMLSQIQELSLAKTGITTLEGIEDLVSLRQLDIRHTKVSSLAPLQKLNGLSKVQLDHTDISHLEPLRGHQQLAYLSFEGTAVKDIMPLRKAVQLKEVWADSAGLSPQQVQLFLDSLDHSCLIIYQTAALKRWWDNLNDAWKAVFRNHVSSDNAPDALALHQMAALTQIRVEGRPLHSLLPLTVCPRLEVLVCDKANIQQIAPLASLNRLQTLSLAENPLTDLALLGNLAALRDLDLHNTPVADLDFLTTLPALQRLNCSGTPVKDLDPLEGLADLVHLDISNTPIKKIKVLASLPKLAHLICFNTEIKAKHVDNLRLSRPDLTIVYY